MLTRILRRDRRRLDTRQAAACLGCALGLSLASGAHAQEYGAPAPSPRPPGAATAASPAVPGDAVLQLLKERGLISAKTADDTSAVVQQMRHVASELVLSAMNFLGVPYRRGGNERDEGFDCSGFTRHVFENSVGLLLPRRVDDQAASTALLTIAREELKPGDLVFFNTLKRTFSHVGIYIGEGKFIHSPRAGGNVRIEDMRMAYWDKRFTGARRAPQVNPTPSDKAANAAALLGATPLPTSAPVQP